MNINKIGERPRRLYSKTPHLKAVYSPSGAFNSPGLPTPNPEEAKFIERNFKSNYLYKRKGSRSKAKALSASSQRENSAVKSFPASINFLTSPVPINLSK